MRIRVARQDELSCIVAIDDDATGLYATAGVVLAVQSGSTFAMAEQARWWRALLMQRVFVAVDDDDLAVGFAAMDVLDGAPYLDQLSVCTAAMGQGVGRALLHHAIAWSRQWSGAHGGSVLWLTTYGHLPWNRPWYEREGFVVMPEAEWPPSIAHHIQQQRAALPHPEDRVAMRRML